MNNKVWGIHWFRRDLRIPGNNSLRWNWKKSNRKVIGIFCFDSRFLSRSDFSHHRFAFFIDTLIELKSEMQKQGGDLLVVDDLPHLAFDKIFTFLREKKISLPKFVSWGRDYEPFAILRDQKVKSLMENWGIEVHTERDHLLIEPWEFKRSDGKGSFYQVYTPYSKQWFAKLNTPEIRARIESHSTFEHYVIRLENNNLEKIFELNWDTLLKQQDFPYQDSLLKFYEENKKHVRIKIPTAGTKEAFKQLNKFKAKIENYNVERDFPSCDGTSKLSIFQKNGSIVSSQIIYFFNLQNQFTKEIVWREFFYSVMYHRPENEKKSFIAKYENIKWENNKSWFQRWKEGVTGFPIIDAGMRQLRDTGWTHNRVRMIVASFLTKDLLIDWRWGEQYFMNELIDGDLAPNNGGWQWAASTGCDPQPYFRVFNPWLQSEKFDHEGNYIKKYVKELRDAPIAALHDPDFDRSPWKYPKPMVEHKIQKNKAIMLFKN